MSYDLDKSARALRALFNRLKPRCGCEERLRQRALRAFDEAQMAEQACDHVAKREHRVIGKSCLLGAKVLSGEEERGNKLYSLPTKK